MSDSALCPHCDYDLFIDDCIDNEYDSGKNISYWVGHCPECGKNFRWKEIYLFDRIEDLVEDDDD